MWTVSPHSSSETFFRPDFSRSALLPKPVKTLGEPAVCKMRADNGIHWRSLLNDLVATVTALPAEGGELAKIRGVVASSLRLLEKAAEEVMNLGPALAAGVASPFLKMFGITLGAALLAKQAGVAAALLDSGQGDAHACMQSARSNSHGNNRHMRRAQGFVRTCKKEINTAGHETASARIAAAIATMRCYHRYRVPTCTIRPPSNPMLRCADAAIKAVDADAAAPIVNQESLELQVPRSPRI
jgi:hypothetical protein